jgi:hypothetical protein
MLPATPFNENELNELVAASDDELFALEFLAMSSLPPLQLTNANQQNITEENRTRFLN